MDGIVILGAGQQGRNSKRLALENGFKVRAFVDDFITGKVEGVDVYERIEDIENYQSYGYHIAIGKTEPRKRFIDEIKRLGLNTITLTDKYAIIEEGAKIGSGNYIYKSAIIYKSAKIGDNNIINCKAVVATDAIIGDNCNISMGCNICGGVEVGDNSYIGCQASIVSGVKIGKNVTVAAGSVVLHDVEDGMFVAGAPAVKKERK